MKRVIIAIFFIALSIYIGVYSLNKTTKICNNMISRIDTITKYNTDILENDNHDKRVEFYNKTQSLHDIWEENSKFFYFFFNNDDIKQLETSIEKLPEHAKNGDLESTYLCLVECLEEFEYIKNSVKLNWDNVF
jgi:HD superfamily phosphohydrolase